MQVVVLTASAAQLLVCGVVRESKMLKDYLIAPPKGFGNRSMLLPALEAFDPATWGRWWCRGGHR